MLATSIQFTSDLAGRAPWPHILPWDLLGHAAAGVGVGLSSWLSSEHLHISVASQNLWTPGEWPSHPPLPLCVVAFSSEGGALFSYRVECLFVGPMIIPSLWPAQECDRGRTARLLGVVQSPQVGGSWRARGIPWVCKLEPAKAPPDRMRVEGRPDPAGALVISSLYLLKPNSRTVKDWSFLFCDQIEVGPCDWRCARVREKMESMGSGHA